METKQLFSQLELEFSNIDAITAQMDNSTFFQKERDEVWSVCEHLQHLILTILPITNLLKQPTLLIERWGHSGRQSRTKAEFLIDYQAAMNGAAWKTIPPFVPQTKSDRTENARVHSSQTVKTETDFYALTGTQIQALPDKLPSADKTSKEEVVALLLAQGKALTSLAANLEEAQLDDMMLPFPYIGLITLRETLIFTQYHMACHYATIAKAAIVA